MLPQCHRINWNKHVQSTHRQILMQTNRVVRLGLEFGIGIWELGALCINNRESLRSESVRALLQVRLDEAKGRTDRRKCMHDMKSLPWVTV